MQEFDLQSLWQAADADANSWYQQQRSEVLRQAQQQSLDTLEQLRQQFRREMGLTIGLGVLFLALIIPVNSWLFWVSMLIVGAAVWYKVRSYRQFQHKLSEVPMLNVRQSTSAYLTILQRYRQSTQHTQAVLAPIGATLGYFIGFLSGSAENYAALSTAKFWLISIPLLLLLGVAGHYYSRWRFRRFFGRREDSLRAILQSLDNIVEEE